MIDRQRNGIGVGTEKNPIPASRKLGRRAISARLSGGKRLSPYAVANVTVAAPILLKLLLRPIARHDEAALGFFAAVVFAA